MIESQLLADFRRARRAMRDEWSLQLARESAALRAQTSSNISIYEYMSVEEHVGNSEHLRIQAEHARHSYGLSRYRLATLYFSAGYLSLNQAIDIDAIRYAIDNLDEDYRVAALAAWLKAIGDCVNSTGHTAQYLRAANPSSATRVSANFRKDVWTRFFHHATRFEEIGRSEWKRRNLVTNTEANELLRTRSDRRYQVVYADPPYTKDQYSRYYHVFETLLLYDYPDSVGMGRYRTDRLPSDFSTKSRVVKAFDELCKHVSAVESMLFLSYPSNGLACTTDIHLEEILHQWFRSVRVQTTTLDHSTLGAKAGDRTKEAIECLYICEP
ncbi:DNA adenine methylase [Gordonia lacunae]|uniref:DNA adenine methylase n=1 Tax=Gordonia lacunae TaxID=417102 RepID=UPI0039E54C74